MLWFDADMDKSSEKKIKEAIEYYRNKNNKNPDLILVPKNYEGEDFVDNIPVKIDDRLRSYDFFICEVD